MTRTRNLTIGIGFCVAVIGLGVVHSRLEQVALAQNRPGVQAPQPGQFYGVHSIAVDSQGNIYTTETWEGKRLQKFVNRGVGPVRTLHQGTVWPGTR